MQQISSYKYEIDLHQNKKNDYEMDGRNMENVFMNCEIAEAANGKYCKGFATFSICQRSKISINITLKMLNFLVRAD